MDELVGDDACQVIEEGFGCRLDVLAAACRPPSEVPLEVVREPHRLKNCGVVPAEFPECHLHLGDGPAKADRLTPASSYLSPAASTCF